MLGNTLVTVQTGDAGKQVNRLYVTDGVDIAHEFYLALLVDRVTGRVAFVVRSEEHTSELQSLMRISYAVFCLKKKKTHSSTEQDRPNTPNQPTTNTRNNTQLLYRH